jgi:chromate transporter
MNGLWDMFLVFFKTSITTFGGGFAMIPLMTQELLAHGWFNSQQVKDLIALSVMTPGAFGSSAAAFAGMKAFGPVGAVVSAAGAVLPSAVLTAVVARFFYGFQKHRIVQGVLSGIKPVVVGLIAGTAFKMLLENLFTGKYASVIDLNALWGFLGTLDWKAVVIFAAAMVSLIKFKLDPVIMILGSGLLGLLFYLVLPLIGL